MINFILKNFDVVERVRERLNRNDVGEDLMVNLRRLSKNIY